MVQRRTILTGLGGSVIGVAGLVKLTQPTAAANVDVDGLSIEDTSETVQGEQTVADVTVSVSGTFDWQASDKPDEYIIKLGVGNGDGSWETIDQSNNAGEYAKDSNIEFDLGGSIIESSFFDLSDFDPSSEGTILTNDVPLRVKGTIIRNGTEIANDSVSANPSVQVTRESVTGNASLVGSSGNISVVVSG